MRILLELFAPLQAALRSPDAMGLLMRRLGWELTFSEAQIETLGSILSVEADLTLIAEAAQGLAQNGLDGEVVEDMINAATRIFDRISTLSTQNPSALASLPAPLNDPAEMGRFALRLPEYLLIRWIDRNGEEIAAFLRLFGVIDDVPTQGLPPRPRLDWEAIPRLLTDPMAQLALAYDWGGDFRHDTAMERLVGLFVAFGVIPRTGAVHPDIVTTWGQVSNSARAFQIEAPIFALSDPRGLFSFYTDLVLAPAAEGGKLAGLQLTNITEGALNAETELGGGWTLALVASGDLNNVLALKALPSGIVFENDTSGAEAAAELRLSLAPDEPIILLGSEAGARLELGQFETRFTTDLTPARQELRLSASTRGAMAGGMRLVISPGDGDSFIADMLGDTPLIIQADLGVSWSSLDGIAFEGGIGFDVDILLDLALGPIKIDTLHLAAFAATDGLTIEAAVTGGLNLGVIAASVEEVGLTARLAPTVEGSSSPLGPLTAGLGFKPPKGLGLAIDAAGIISGGGYLSHDPALAEYAGAAQIGFVALKLSAIGILTTRMPDGSDGWSLFLAVYSEFPPINIGFGFTLNGVGGMIGLHRSFDDEALRERLLAGALDSILFPEDPVANAPRILSDIRAVFPASQGQFVFGAMMKIGWGTPTVLTLDLGVIVELPDPIKIALLGQLSMALPKPDKTIIELNMDVFGVVNLSEGTIALDATIRDSHILHLLTLSGDMAFRAAFGDQPNMVLSIGGFHPKFTPPDNVPSLRPMKAALPLGKNASVELKSYLAVTSNSVQAGGRLEIWVKVAGFTAEGWFGFDALIQFSPFGFDFLVSFGVTVRAGRTTLMGVDVTCTILGPGPWVIEGTARFEILKVKKKIHIALEMGRKQTVSVPVYDVAALLATALNDPAAWQASGPDSTGYVILAAGADDDDVRLHPSGGLRLQQGIIPLGQSLEKFGNGTITGPRRFSILSAGFDGGSSGQTSAVQDWFAPAEYFAMKDLERIKSPAFAAYDAGITLASDAVSFGPTATRESGFEEITLDPSRNTRHAKAKALGSKTLDLSATLPGGLFKQGKALKPQFHLKGGLA